MSPDLYNGTAGRLRAHLILWDETGERADLQAARLAGERLLAAASEPRPGELHWVIPPGYASLSGKAYAGYAHGAASIGDTLMDLFDATGDERFLAAARGAARWLARLAVPGLDEGSGLKWPPEEGARAIGPVWCHGTSGVAAFLAHAARLDLLPGAHDLEDRAILTVAHGGRSLGPTQCHGLAGSIECLLDHYRATGRREILAEARTLARLLDAFAVEQDGDLAWYSDEPTVVAPDYMVGFSGVALCLLRLADPERRPRQLTREGFRFRHGGPDVDFGSPPFYIHSLITEPKGTTI